MAPSSFSRHQQIVPKYQLYARLCARPWGLGSALTRLMSSERQTGISPSQTNESIIRHLHHAGRSSSAGPGRWVQNRPRMYLSMLWTTRIIGKGHSSQCPEAQALPGLARKACSAWRSPGSHCPLPPLRSRHKSEEQGGPPSAQPGAAQGASLIARLAKPESLGDFSLLFPNL